MKRMLLTLLAAFGLIVPSLRAQEETATSGNWADVANIEWYGTGTASTYTITTAEQLAGLAKLVNEGTTTFEGKTITLSANVDLAGKEWTPIGNGARSGSSYTGAAFKGTFNAGSANNRRTISGLTIKVKPSNADAALGLFGVVDGGTVSSVILKDVSISLTNAECVGGAVGLMVNGATVSAVSVGGSITATRGIGGIVGRMTRWGTISKCSNTAPITATGGANLGGIVGAAYYTHTEPTKKMVITECSNTGALNSSAGGVGGIVGLSSAYVTYCSNTAAVVGSGDSVGGVVGEQRYLGAVVGCPNSGNVTNNGAATAYGTGGIIGWVRYSGVQGDVTTVNPTQGVISVKSNTNSGTVSGKNDAGGIIGTLYDAGIVEYNKNTAPQILANGSSKFVAGIVGNIQYEDETEAAFKTPNDVKVVHNLSTTTKENLSEGCTHLYAYNNNSDGTQETVIEPNYSGTEEKDLTIATLDDLKAFRDYVNAGMTFAGKTVTLTANIDLNNEEWTPIGDKNAARYFEGSFIGQPAEGETQVFLSNLKIDALADADREYQALFGAIEGATIKNLKVAGSVKAKNAAGIVARMNGETNGSLIENCTNVALVNGGTSKAGGIVCLTYGTCTIERCKNESAIGGAATGGLGGIVAYGNGNTTTIRECENVGDVGDEKARYAGGIVGYATGAGSIVEGCVNKGAIQAGTNVGGITGISTGSWTIQSSTNEGEVTGVGGCTAGGIVGSNAAGRVEACANRGNVTGKYAGGVAGKMGEAGQMVDCSGGDESVSITATGAAGRLIGVVENGPNESQAAFLTIDDANGDDYTSLPTVGLMGPNTAWGSLKVLAGTFHGEPSMGGNYGDLYFLPGTAWERNGSVDTSVAGKWRLTSNTDGWKQIEKTAIAKVGETDCSSWAEMVSAKTANPEATVTLLLDTFAIATLDDLKAFRDLVNAGVTFRGKTLTLTANIDLKNEEWTPIGTKDNSFQGTFDGDGKTISNLKVTEEASYVGLFGKISDPAKLSKLTVENASVAGLDNVGALVGAAYTGTVEDCHVKGKLVIEGKYMVGGLAGSGYADIYNCSVRGTAENPAIVTATYREQNLEGDNVGGLVGYRGEGKGIETIGCSVEYVKVTGSRKVGGLIGSAFQNNVIEGCSVANATIVCGASSDYAIDNQKTLGFGGLVGLYTAYGQSDGTLFECAVSDITFEVPDGITCSTGVVTGGLRGSSVPVVPSDSMTIANVTISGTNTGVTNDYLADAPTYVYPTEKFDSASAFIKSFPEGKTVYDGEEYYATMVEALKAIHLTGKNTLWCKPGADVGTMTHGHVCQSLTVYGNGATVTGGEHDFELDNTTTPSSEYGDCPEQAKEDVTLKIVALNQVAVWGANIRDRVRTVTLEDCKDVYRVYLTSGGHAFVGTNNITLRRCTGTAEHSDGSTSYCKVFSIVPGTIVVEDCTFTGVPEPINLRNRSAGNQKVTVTNCTFTDCATTAIADKVKDEAWAAPIRVCVTDDPAGSTNLTVTDCTFSYTAGTTKCNGDILMGEGRDPKSWNSYPTVTATLVNTAAEVYVLQPGDRTAEGVTPTKTVNVEASATETVIKNTLPIAEVDGVAYDTLSEVMAAIGNKVAGGATAVTVKLLSDVSVENTMLSIPNGLALTLDLNGKTYTYTDDRTDDDGVLARYAVYLGETSTLTVTDSSAEQKGTVKATGTALCCLNNNGGTLNVLGGNFVVESSKSSYAIITRGGACTLEPEDGKTIVCTGGLKAATGTVRIAGETTINGQGAYYAIYVGEQSGSQSASIEIAGGTFTAGSNGLAICVDTNWGVQAKATFDISDGTFTGAFGGTGIGTYTLSGGSYSVDPTTTVKPSTVTLKPNYLPVQNAKDYYVVGPFVVAITDGDAKGGYTTLQAAVDAVSALVPTPDPMPTITLLRDVVLEDEVTLTKNISIDLAGHTLYAKDGNTPAFKADTKVTVTFVKEEGAEAVKGSFIAAAQKTGAPNVTISGLEPLAITKWTDVGAYDISWYEDVVKDAGNEALSFTISTVREFAGLASLPANPFMAGDTITLTGDIDLSALEWVPPAYGFLAELDGAGHQISGLWTGDEATTGCTGLFAYIAPGGIVKNLRLSGATIVAKSGKNPAGGRGTVQYAGVFAGVLEGTIQNCVATECTVTVKTSTTPQGFGGIVGTGSGTIKDCLVSGVTFEGSTTTGSFVGAGSATITNCYVDGALAQTSGTLTNVYAKDAEGRFVRHNTGDGTLPPETLGAGAALNGIGWLLNGQKTEDTTAWRVDSNEECTTLLPFKADGVEVIPDVERYLTTSSNWDTTFPEGGTMSRYGYYANGHTAIVKRNAEGKVVLTTKREDYLVDEELEITDTPANVAIFGGSFGGVISRTDLTVEDTGTKTFGVVFAGSFSKDAEHPAKITGTAKLTIKGGRVTKAYGGSCGDASTVASAKLTLNGGTVTTAVATSNGGAITGTATLTVSSATAAKLVAMERGTAKNVTFTMNGATTGGICLSADSATAEASVMGTVKLDNKVANPGTVYLGAALEKVRTLEFPSYNQYLTTVFAQTATKAKAEKVTIPVGNAITLGYNVTLQVPANVRLEVAGMVTLSNGKLVGTSGTSLLEVLEGASATSLPQGLSSWDVLTSKWVQAQIKAGNGAYYGTVAQALAALAAGDTVTLLSKGVATENVLATSAGKTVYSGDAYDVADVLGGVFTVTVENNTPRLVYAYDLGVGGLTIRKAAEGETAGTDGLVVEVTVKLAEGEVAPSRELADCTLTVTSILDKDANTKQDFKLEGLTFTNGECKVTIPYEKMGLGTNRLTVSVSKGEATPPAEGGEETL